MINFTLMDAAKIVNSTSEQLPAELAFHGISIDTRTLTSGNLFIALRGEKHDGHDYLAIAQEKKAIGAIVNRSITSVSLPQILVKDSITALSQLTQAWRMRFDLPMIAITGSNGKTTTKNMVASILRAACLHQDNAVLATIGTLNNHLGVPLTLARLNHAHQYAVLELGMNHPLEIATLSMLVQPTIALITQAAVAHFAGVHNIEGVARAKAEIFLGLTKNGIAILNQDDPYFDYWQHGINKRPYISFGFQKSAHVHLCDPPTAIRAHQHHQAFKINTPSGTISMQCPLLGTHMLYNALAATATAIALNLSLDAIQTGIETVKPASGRMERHVLGNGMTLIDDTYNANPCSTIAAISTLAVIPGKKILILGDMQELGTDANNWHVRIGVSVKNSMIDYLLTHGQLMAHAASVYGKRAMHFEHQEELIPAIQNLLSSLAPPVTILIKGSRSMKMERIINQLRLSFDPSPSQ